MGVERMANLMRFTKSKSLLGKISNENPAISTLINENNVKVR